MVEHHARADIADSLGRVPILLAVDAPLLDDIVGQKLACDFISVFRCQVLSRQAVSLGGVNRLVRGKSNPQNVLRRLHGGASGVVPNAGAVPDPHDAVEFHGKGFVGGNLGDRVRENLGLQFFQLVRREVGVDGDNMHRANALRLYAEIIRRLFSNAFSLGVEKFRLQSDFKSMGHG